MEAFDEHGWAIGPVAALAPEHAYTVLCTEGRAALDLAALAVRGAAHGIQLAVEPPKRYPGATTPIADAARVTVVRRSHEACVRVVTFPAERGRALIDQAATVASLRGGAGMDALVRRARRVWQAHAEDEPLAALCVAALLSSAHLGAILPPDGAAIFGPKTAFERIGGA